MPISLAEASGTASVTSAVVDGLKTVATDMQSTITSILPVALGVVGAVLVVTFGIKIFKKITGK